MDCVRVDFYSTLEWRYFNENGDVAIEKGLYLICDNGYLAWPCTIAPFMRSSNVGRLEDYFSCNLESVRKDIECVFGILKSRWTCLSKGFKY